MAKSAQDHPALNPDLGKANGNSPDRGQPSGHTRADHAHPTRELKPSEKDPPGDGEHRATEKARPWDTDRGGA
jgi:hypothetical protein